MKRKKPSALETKNEEGRSLFKNPTVPHIFQNIPEETWLAIFVFGTNYDYYQLLFVSKWCHNLFWNHMHTLVFHESTPMTLISKFNPKSLQILHLHSITVGEPFATTLSQNCSLTSLFAENCNFSTPEFFKNITKVKEIEFRKNPRAGYFHENISIFIHLTSLSLHFEQISELQLENLKNISTLHHLQLSTCPYVGRLSFLTSCHSLHSLDIHNCPKVKDLSLKSITHLTSLTTLALEHCPITDNAIHNLKSLSHLSHLSLIGTHVTGKELNRLAVNLKSLSLADTGITDENMHFIGGLRNLRNLNLDGTAVSDVGLWHLVDMPNLERVDAACKNVTSVGLSLFQSVWILNTVQ